MISSNMLEGIQVTKSVTADMDADVLGGSINFQIREARTEIPGRAQFNLLMQGGYNNLSNAINKYNNYKYVFSAENRFMEEKLGIFGQLDVERKNLMSNEMGAAYDKLGASTTEYITNGVNLFYIPRDRMRYNGALVLDYRLPEGKIKLANFLSTGNTDTKSRQENFDIALNQHSYTFSNSNAKLSTITNTIEYSDQLPVFRITTRLSHTYSETKTPNQWLASFKQSSAGFNSFVNKPNLDPKDIVKAANNRAENTYLSNFSSINTFSKERALNGALDLETDLNISDFISSVIKFGGKLRYQERSYNYDVYNSKGGEGGLELLSATVVDSLIAAELGLPGNLGTSIPITYFTDPRFNYGTFMGGDFTMVNPLDYGKLARISNLLDRTKDYFAQRNLQIAYGPDNQKSTTNNYSGNEMTSAFYLMSVVNVGPMLTIIPGVRYQNLRTEYTGVRGVQSSQSYYSYNHYDTTVVQNHGYWLPSVSIRYKPFTWFDIRMSYTNTLAYPDYNAIVPRIDVNLNNRIDYNNFDLKPSRSRNYDAYLSFYNNELGLFTVGGFLKQIDDLIFGWTFNVSRGDALKYYPGTLVTTPPSGNATINTYINNKFRVDNYGAEVDWQTHFWYLPGILSGFVLNVNYTHIFSEADYPMSFIKVENRITKFVDTSYSARLLFQPNDIVNLSLGFDYSGFSARVSMLYQANIFTGTNFWPQLRTNTEAYTRWDLTAKQDLPWFGMQIYGELNNINGALDVSVIQAAAGVPSLKQDYGMTANIGVKLKL
ncbi:MAG: TonB-dependent receptor domain-containing protein, partial [Syntrophothermus sp.]